MNTIHYPAVGPLKQDDTFDDWWRSAPIDIPFFGKQMAITFIDFVPAEGEKFNAGECSGWTFDGGRCLR